MAPDRSRPDEPPWESALIAEAPFFPVVQRARSNKPTTGAKGLSVGRPVGSEVPIPLDTFWTILGWLVTGEKKSARAIANATEEDRALSYVNRVKAGVIVKWVKAHPKAARAALGGRKIPPSFRATADGVFLPKP